MRVLIIGPLSGQVTAASKIAHQRGAKVRHASDIEMGLSSLRSGQGADLILADVKLDIKHLIDSLAAERISIPVVGCGIEANSEEAARAIRNGAKEYLPLPPDEEMIAAILEAISTESHPMIYAAPAIDRVVKLADQIAGSDASVLITGESGTGKEVIARYLHRKSKRADQPFISINCAAIPENLLESELFGHEKGAFTGAVARRIGKFEEANNGTLLLDEISEMDLRLQAKLLRAIQERVIDRVGGNEPVRVNIRILATSNRNLEEEVAKGTFRQDLFFRLNVITLQMPALRERSEDIPLLADHFIKKYATLNGVPERPLSPVALEKLKAHKWPGNVRELENTIHRAVLLSSGSAIEADAILLAGGNGNASSAPVSEPSGTPVSGAASESGSASAQPAATALVGRTLDSVERDLIISTLDHCLGNRTHAANILGISIRTLRNKLKLYADQGVPVPPPHEGSEAA